MRPSVDEQRLDGIPTQPPRVASIIADIKAAAVNSQHFAVVAVDLHRPPRDESEEVAGISVTPIESHSLTVPEDTDETWREVMRALNFETEYDPC